jgi:hypothetical protein
MGQDERLLRLAECHGCLSPRRVRKGDGLLISYSGSDISAALPEDRSPRQDVIAVRHGGRVSQSFDVRAPDRRDAKATIDSRFSTAATERGERAPRAVCATLKLGPRSSDVAADTPRCPRGPAYFYNPETWRCCCTTFFFCSACCNCPPVFSLLETEAQNGVRRSREAAGGAQVPPAEPRPHL